MRVFLALLLVSGFSFCQSAPPPVTASPADSNKATSAASANGSATALVIPAGTKVPLSLTQAISTKHAVEGDAVYAQTTFPFVVNERILIPAGTYIQGKIAHVERAGHGRGRSEILIHFTTMIYPTGYTLMLPASVENTPGADDNTVKDEEGTIQADKDTGKKAEDAIQKGAYGGAVGGVGGLAVGGTAARVGGLAGIGAGVAWALLKRGPDVKLEVGSSIEMEIQRPITVDPSRIQVAKARP